MEKLKSFIKNQLKIDWRRLLNVVLLIVFIAGAFYCAVTSNITIEKESLYWFFSATAQSTAAMFAVVGMFVLFRHRLLSENVGNLKGILKGLFVSNDGIRLYGDIKAAQWLDSEVLDKSRELLEQEKSKERPRPLSDELKGLLNRIEATIKETILNQAKRTVVLSAAKFPLIAMLITFMISILCLPFSDKLSTDNIGGMILVISIFLISASTVLTSLLIYKALTLSKKAIS